MFSKFHAKPEFRDGIRFASGAEARRYDVLKAMQDRGEITDLKLQPTFKMPPGFSYRADFAYYVVGGGYVVEEVKGMATPEFKLKLKCFWHFFPEKKLIILRERKRKCGLDFVPHSVEAKLRKQVGKPSTNPE